MIVPCAVQLFAHSYWITIWGDLNICIKHVVCCHTKRLPRIYQFTDVHSMINGKFLCCATAIAHLIYLVLADAEHIDINLLWKVGRVRASNFSRRPRIPCEHDVDERLFSNH